MPIDVYDVQTDMGATPPPAPAMEGADSGVPGAPAETPAAPQQDAGAPPAPASPSSGEGEGDDADDDAQAVSLEDFNRHMGRLRQRQRRAERALATERAAYQQEMAQMRGQLDLMTRLMQGQGTDLAPQAPQGPPQAEQYQSHEDFVRASGRYEAQQVQQAERQQQEIMRQQQQLIDREAAFKAQHVDYDEMINSRLRGKVAPHVAQALQMLPDGPALAYALAQQPDLVQRLNQLPPPLLFAELGRLSPPPAAPPGAPPPATTGSAPSSPAPPLDAPYTPANGQGSAPTGTYTEGMSQEAYRAWRARTSQQPRWQQQRRG